MEKYLKIINEIINKNVEEEWFEFKMNWSEPNGIGEYISALSNSAAMCKKEFAYLIWGINDETHEVVGTTFDFRGNVKNEPLEHYLARQTTPDVAFSFHEICYEEKRLVLLEIAKAKNIPTSFGGIRYIRIGSSKVNLVKYPEREANLFEVLRNVEQTIETIESEYQDLTFERLFTYYAGRGILLKADTFKKNLGLLTKDGKYNLMAQLLSDDSHISVRVSIFNGETKAASLYSVKEFGNTCILLTLDKVLEYADVINIIQADESNRVLTRKDVSLFDASAFREAIINAFVHNKWVDGNAPMITVYNNRIEILSRGTLDSKQTIEGFYLGESIPVNQKLSDIFLQLHISERSGRGVPKILDVYGKDVFDFRENSIAVNIPFHWINKKEETVVKKVSNKATLEPRHKQVLKELRKNPKVTQLQLANILGVSKSAVEKHIKFLKENGYIEREGSNKTGYWKLNR
ncbi:putative DNA binding domain-containing protein [Aerococcaceae bacterium zg-B36]|uniref:RNA-binding domain-containing protein n=1 Tax=Aerococcaceae bacterium zg-252 TaxID=2796928 RepID=UPI001BD83333|nr:putative DNA binding domain-containing protein [Aerococcaceae bacterium zg-B36]